LLQFFQNDLAVNGDRQGRMNRPGVTDANGIGFFGNWA
jgi:hypothetical protein